MSKTIHADLTARLGTRVAWVLGPAELSSCHPTAGRMSSRSALWDHGKVYFVSGPGTRM